MHYSLCLQPKVGRDIWMQIFFIIFDLSATKESGAHKSCSLNALVLLTKVRLFLRNLPFPLISPLAHNPAEIFYSFTATKIPFVKMPKVDGTCKYWAEKAFRTVIKSQTHIRPFQPTKQFHSTCGHILTNFTFQGLHKNLWIAKSARALCAWERSAQKQPPPPHALVAVYAKKKRRRHQIKKYNFHQTFRIFHNIN
jgi:hypothetical protein